MTGILTQVCVKGNSAGKHIIQFDFTGSSLFSGDALAEELDQDW